MCPTGDMAELRYNDIQRAVQDALRTVQNDMQRISATVNMVERHAERIDTVEMGVRDMQRNVQVMLGNNGPGVQVGADNRLTQLMNDVHELKVRFAAVERFVQQMDMYLRPRIEEDEEDRRYRAG